jgi:hypothetical protein
MIVVTRQYQIASNVPANRERVTVKVAKWKA